MPKKDGVELCRRIKKDKKFIATPILIFSALGIGIKTMFKENEGADDYLGKPFENKELLEKVKKLINKKGN
jgi:DNA-binding response OmpR family regulator